MKLKGADESWRYLLECIMVCGDEVSPRGMKTKEMLHTNTISVDMRRPVVTTKARKLNYKFMAAEALWILAGRNDVESLSDYVPRMAEFSDNGEVLAGAYGPRITPQLPYVVDALVRDRDTRQAVLTIWTPNPPPSKDIPCTISMCFSIRARKLHQHVYMRSSDGWLGIPYDIFSFCMVGLKVRDMYNQAVRNLYDEGLIAPKPKLHVQPGIMTISMTSSHLYERDWPKVETILATEASPEVVPLPLDLVWEAIESSLVAMREGWKSADYGWNLKGREHD